MVLWSVVVSRRSTAEPCRTRRSVFRAAWSTAVIGPPGSLAAERAPPCPTASPPGRRRAAPRAGSRSRRPGDAVRRPDGPGRATRPGPGRGRLPGWSLRDWQSMPRFTELFGACRALAMAVDK
ncbi:hypothetical protein GCM10017750_22500 [Streptomyces racemochromogenes]